MPDFTYNTLLRPKNAEPLERWSADDFAHWLYKGFASSDTLNTAFEPLHKLILPTIPLTDQIAQIYSYLTENAQHNFVMGIAQAVTSLPSTNDGRVAYDQLIHLCGMIATPLPLKHFVERLRDPSFLRSVNSKKAQEIYALTFNICAGMTPKQPARHAVVHLIFSPEFEPYWDEGYMPMATDALRCAPA